MAINNLGQDIADGFDKCTNKKTILTANNSVFVINPNPKREYAAVVLNTPGEITVILGEPTGGRIGEGILLVGKGASYEIKKSNPYKGKVSAISATSVELGIVECEKSA